MKLYKIQQMCRHFIGTCDYIKILTEIPVGLIPPLGVAPCHGSLPAGLPASTCFGSRVNSGAPPALEVRVVGEAKASEGPPRFPVAPHHPC